MAIAGEPPPIIIIDSKAYDGSPERVLNDHVLPHLLVVIQVLFLGAGVWHCDFGRDWRREIFDMEVWLIFEGLEICEN